MLLSLSCIATHLAERGVHDQRRGALLHDGHQLVVGVDNLRTREVHMRFVLETVRTANACSGQCPSSMPRSTGTLLSSPRAGAAEPHLHGAAVQVHQDPATHEEEKTGRKRVNTSFPMSPACHCSHVHYASHAHTWGPGSARALTSITAASSAPPHAPGELPTRSTRPLPCYLLSWLTDYKDDSRHLHLPRPTCTPPPSPCPAAPPGCAARSCS